MCVYGSEENEKWLRDEWARTGKKLDMGKSCIRFKKLSDLPLDVIGKLIKRVPAKKYIEHYEAGRDAQGSAKKTAASAASAASTTREPAPKKTASKKTAAPKKTAPSKKAASKQAASRAN
jgi:hypothetical protein